MSKLRCENLTVKYFGYDAAISSVTTDFSDGINVVFAAEKGGKTLEEFLEQAMNAGKRKRFSNRVNHLASQNKISWAKAFRLDPYTCDAFDEDFDQDCFEDCEDVSFEKRCMYDKDNLPPVKRLHFNGEFSIEFR